MTGDPTSAAPAHTRGLASSFARSLRVHQWSKNALLVLPGLAGHIAWTGADLTTLLSGLLAFSFTASGLYLVNDVVDAPHDRAHPLKRNRPVASGALPVWLAWAGAAALLAAAAALAFGLPPGFRDALGVYLVLSASYSLGLKRLVLVDVVLLSTLYTVRVVAGGLLLDVDLSRWFLAFSVFFFTSLALVKRAVEVRGARDAEREIGGRGYHPSDLPVLRAFGAATATAAAVVYGLYITSSDVLILYGTPDLLWLGLPLMLYWIARVWLLVGRPPELRGPVPLDDPVSFVLRDRVSWVVAGAFMAVVWLAR